MLTNEEIRTLLLEKHEQIIHEQKIFQGISLSVCIGLLLFLSSTAILHSSDTLFVFLNTVIILIVIPLTYSCLYNFRQWYINNKGNCNIKALLEARVAHLDRLIRLSKWQSVFIIIFVGLLGISIHTFFSKTAMSVILEDEESRWGLLAGFCAGSISALIGAKALTKRFKNNLSKLSSILKNF